MKTNLFAIIMISGLTFACGGRIDNKQEGIVGVSGVAGQASSFAGSDSMEADTFSTGGTFEISAGGTTSVGGSISETATGGTTEPPCEPKLNVEYISHGTATVSPGANDVTTLTLKLTAECKELNVRSIGFRIGAVENQNFFDESPFRNNGQENFLNIQLKTSDGKILGGPTTPYNRKGTGPAFIDFNNSFTIAINNSVQATITLDVSPNFSAPEPSVRYSMFPNFEALAEDGVQFVFSYTSDFSSPGAFPTFTVTKPAIPTCRLEKTIPLSVYTETNSIQASSKGFFVLGTNIASDSSTNSTKQLQYWNTDTKSLESSSRWYSSSFLVQHGGTSDGFLVVDSGPETYGSKILSAYDANGTYQTQLMAEWYAPITATNPRGWPFSAPSSDTIVTASGNAKRQIFWRKRNVESDPYTLVSNTLTANQFEQAELQYTWPKNGLHPEKFVIATTSSNDMIVASRMACDDITLLECPQRGWNLMFWNANVPVEQRSVNITQVTDGVSDIFPSNYGFDVIFSNSTDMYVSKYDQTGNFLGRVNLPPKSRAVTAFRGGYAVITTSPDSLKNFEFILVDADGTIKQTIPFQSDFDRYELAIGNLVVSGTGTLAFTWSGLAQTTSSSLAFFACQ